jgi:pilus assembly protein CpaD
MSVSKTLFLRQAVFLGFAAALALTPAGHAFAKAKPGTRGLESPNQPVVQRTDFVFDATPDGSSNLSAQERARVLDWFDAIDLGYGDRVAVVDSGLSGATNAVSDLVARYGLLLSDRAPATVGTPASGGIRIVVSRSTASVPGCPDWSHHQEADFTGGLSNEYGCSVNGNLAAMIADPEDLVRGRETRSILRGAIASRAIKAFRDAAPTGGGGTATK